MSSNFYVATLATRECADELELLHSSLRAFHSPEEVPLVVGCSSDLIRHLEKKNRQINSSLSLLSDPSIKWIPCLDSYGAINRQAMERQPGIWYPTRHCDFMMEKANVMDWALQNLTPQNDRRDDQDENAMGKNRVGKAERKSFPVDGVLFVDSDITFFSPLSDMFPASSLISSSSSSSSHVATPPILGVSPHEIRQQDEALFGRYNGGMLFAAHPVVLWHWRRATHSSRYFDQASIEDVVEEMERAEGPDAVLKFPPHVNYGFWRMFQSPRTVEEEAKRFSIHAGGGICYQGSPLQSVHTHFFMTTPCREIPVFNSLLKKWIREVQVTSPNIYRGLLKLVV